MATPINIKSETAQRFTKEEQQEALERVLNSKYFVHAPMKQKFLRLICDFHLNGRDGELNEYLIGREVFDRDDSYNPATDPIVRVGAHGVREKLTLYYQKEGSADKVRIEIPVGSYEPVFVGNAPSSEAEPVLISGQPQEKVFSSQESPAVVAPLIEKTTVDRSSRWLSLLGIAASILAAALIALLFINQALRGQVESAELNASKIRGSFGLVWGPFLENSDSTLLILSNPTVHRAANPADPEAVTRRGINLTPEQASILTDASNNRLPIKTDRPLQLVPAFNTYTGIGEAVGVYRLANLLHAAGEGTVLKQSRNIGPDDLKSYDVILLGSVYANQWSKPLSVKENFVYTSRASIENLAPQPGEEHEYKAAFNPQTGSLIEDHALITVTPGVSGDKTVMVLAGIYSEGTEAAAEYITNLTSLNEINSRLRQLSDKKTTPKYYQALLKVRVENAFPTKISLVTIRELKSGSE